MMLGGSMFPLSSMPAWLAALGRWTPSGWGNEQLSAILLGETGPLPLPIAFGMLFAVIAMCLVLAGIQLTRSFARS
jgi:ABC-type multidrug transport system permease subunit